MSITTPENIIRVLTFFNPWWKDGSVSESLLKPYRRFAFGEAMGLLDSKQIRRTVILSGPRRVGKTTILYQMIQELLNRGITPRQILFLSMDHPVLKLSQFGDILECYHRNLYAGQDAYYFIDEVQYAQDWSLWLKTLYDTCPHIHVVATGSASQAIVRGNQDSGVGRWSIIRVPTLSFYEFCELTLDKQPDLPDDLTVKQLLSMTRPERTAIMLQLSTLEAHFNHYLIVGGFPELSLMDDRFLAQQMIRDDIVDKALKRDLPSLYNIRNATELERIFIYLCNVSSQIVSIETLSKELNGVSRSTTENYIRYLESANLIYQSLPTDLHGKRILKAKPKIYIADAAIRNAVLLNDMIHADATEMGLIAETAVYSHVFQFCYRRTTAVGYYRDSRKNKEIDIVVDYPTYKKVLIEVKYRDRAPLPDTDAISELADTAELAIVVTKFSEDYGVHHASCGKKLLRIPAFAFLYLLGHAEKHGITTF